MERAFRRLFLSRFLDWMTIESLDDSSIAEAHIMQIDEDSDPGESISELRSLNASLPIMLLPPEILCQIFMEYHATCVKPPRLPSFPRLYIAHVSHHWRCIAFQLPMLWGAFQLALRDDQGPTFELLARSKATPLTISLDCWLVPRMTLTKTFGEFHRCRSINLPLPYYWLPHELKSIYPKEAPILREITFRDECLSEDKLHPDCFDGCSLPALKKLHLEGGLIDPTKSIFAPSLVHLFVHSRYRSNRISQVLDTLQRVPNLEFLDLKIRIEDTDREVTGSRRVDLPHIRYLSLSERGDPELCTHILPHLRFPSTTSIYLEASNLDATWRKGIKQFFDNQPFLFGDDQGCLPLRSVAVSLFDMPSWILRRTSIRVAFWTEVLSFDELLRPQWTTPPRLLLRSKAIPIYAHSIQDGFDTLDVVKSISKIETCIIGGFQGQFPKQLAAKMPQVNTLYLSNSNIDSVCDALTENQSRRRGREKFKFLWPNLKRLAIEKIVLEPMSSGKISQMLEVRRKARTKRGGINILRLIQCSRLDIAIFSPYIADVAHHPGPYVKDRLVLQDSFEI